MLCIGSGHIVKVIAQSTELTVALKGAEYLEELLRENALISEPSITLDNKYQLKKPPHLTQKDIPLGTSSQELFLSKEQFNEIAKEYQDEEIAVLGKRAITQITKQLDTEALNREQLEKQQQPKGEGPKGTQEQNEKQDSRKQ